MYWAQSQISSWLQILDNFSCCRNWPCLWSPVGFVHLAESIFIFWKCSSNWGLCWAEPSLLQDWKLKTETCGILRESAGADVGNCQFILRLIPDFMTDIFSFWRLGTKRGSKISHPEELRPYWGWSEDNLRDLGIHTDIIYSRKGLNFPLKHSFEAGIGCSRNTQPDELKTELWLCWVECFVPESK